MGILNVTPDSFSGDGLLAADATRSTRRGRAGAPDGRRGRGPPRHRRRVDAARPRDGRARPRSSPGSCRSSRPSGRRCPAMPISIDTTKPAVAEAALDAGADLVNDVWGVGPDDALVRLAAARGVPAGRDAQPRRAASTTDVVAEVVADLRARSSGRSRLGVAARTTDRRSRASGSARPPSTTSCSCATSARCGRWAGPILLGTSRKSTLGQGARPAGRRAARGDARHDRARASPPARTSSASTMCGPTSARPG